MWELVPEPILFADTIEQIRPDPIHEDPYHTIPPEPPRTPKPSFFEGHPDLEKFRRDKFIPLFLVRSSCNYLNIVIFDTPPGIGGL